MPSGILAIIAAGTFYLVVFHQNPPLEVFNLPLPTDKQIYFHGETLRVFSDFCRYTNAPYILNLEFRNASVFHLSPVEGPGLAPGCYSQWFSMVIIPSGLSPGKYVIFGKSTYWVNPLSKKTVAFETVPFWIVVPGR